MKCTACIVSLIPPSRVNNTATPRSSLASRGSLNDMLALQAGQACQQAQCSGKVSLTQTSITSVQPAQLVSVMQVQTECYSSRTHQCDYSMLDKQKPYTVSLCAAKSLESTVSRSSTPLSQGRKKIAVLNPYAGESAQQAECVYTFNHIPQAYTSQQANSSITPHCRPRDKVINDCPKPRQTHIQRMHTLAVHDWRSDAQTYTPLEQLTKAMCRLL